MLSFFFSFPFFRFGKVSYSQIDFGGIQTKCIHYVKIASNITERNKSHDTYKWIMTLNQLSIVERMKISSFQSNDYFIWNSMELFAVIIAFLSKVGALNLIAHSIRPMNNTSGIADNTHSWLAPFYRWIVRSFLAGAMACGCAHIIRSYQIINKWLCINFRLIIFHKSKWTIFIMWIRRLWAPNRILTVARWMANHSNHDSYSMKTTRNGFL